MPESVTTQPNTTSPQKLFEECEAREKRLSALDFKQLKVRLFKLRNFGRPWFKADKELESLARKHLSRDVKIQDGTHRVSKYRVLLTLLRKAKDADARLFVLAWWLKQEGICEPEELLPKGMLQRWANSYFSDFSTADLRNACLVRTWYPYFEQLLADLREVQRTPHRLREKLGNGGYDREAIVCAIGKRTPTAAVCEWLEQRIRIDARTIRNAYSRVLGTKRSATPARGKSSP